VDRGELERWLAAYERAWRTPGTDALAGLFADDAIYSNNPYGDTHRGIEAIARLWERERDGPDEAFEMGAVIVAVEGDTGAVRVAVRYGEPKPAEYRDLWIVRLDEDGRCVAFEEWPFWPPGQGG
jgi:ketosteroid isomerase-like protein